MISKIYHITLNCLWALCVALLPITSLPLVVKVVKSDVVGAPSGVILFFLVLIWLVPYLLRRGILPSITLVIMGFATFALISSIVAFFLPIPPFREISFIANEAKALLTLGVGICLYLVVCTLCFDQDRLKFTLRIIGWSGFVVMLWSAVQAFSWYAYHSYPAWMETIHRSISTGVLFKDRVCGFSLEPSWLAHQLNMLYLPLWLAFTYRNESVYSFRFLGIFSFENILLAGGVFEMLLTFSRIGWLAFLCMIAYILLKLAKRFIIWVQHRYTLLWERTGIPTTKKYLNKRLVIAISIFIFLIAGAGLFIGAGLVFRHFDPRMEAIFRFSIEHEDPIMYYAQQLEFGPRVTYWIAGWKVFEDFPWLGVGLGNTGYFMQQNISAYGWRFPEVRNLIFDNTGLINSKNLWVRLLAETGIIGFILFFIWLIVEWLTGKHLESLSRKSNPLYGSVGLAGLLTILGLIIEGFSVDSFALPYFWFSLGLVSAGFITIRSGRKETTVNCTGIEDSHS